jgi:hypothetical protein
VEPLDSTGLLFTYGVARITTDACTMVGAGSGPELAHIEHLGRLRVSDVYPTLRAIPFG